MVKMLCIGLNYMKPITNMYINECITACISQSIKLNHVHDQTSVLQCKAHRFFTIRARVPLITSAKCSNMALHV